MVHSLDYYITVFLVCQVLFLKKLNLFFAGVFGRVDASISVNRPYGWCALDVIVGVDVLGDPFLFAPIPPPFAEQNPPPLRRVGHPEIQHQKSPLNIMHKNTYLKMDDMPNFVQFI